MRGYNQGMDKEEILNMPAGREMDALIFEYVFKKEESASLRDEHGNLRRSWTDAYGFEGSDYSTDISAAWEVLERLKAISGVTIGIRVHPTAGYSVNIYQLGINYWPTEDTLPLAICRAALLSCLVTNPK